MNPEFEKIPLIKNEANKRFEMHINGHLAFINYEEDDDQILSLVHTEVAPELAGSGAASVLVNKTLTFLKEKNILIQPFCPYVFAYIKKHPEWKDGVYKGFAGYNRL